MSPSRSRRRQSPAAGPATASPAARAGTSAATAAAAAGPGASDARNLTVERGGSHDGFSSLTNLKRLPIDELKTDLAHALGLIAVAEGVEAASAWEMLAAHGCDLAQGD
jgi:hypothetical protein